MSEHAVEAEVTSGQLCRGISKMLGAWQEAANGEPRYRLGTWARWPYRFAFKEFEEPGLLGAKYQLLSLSVPLADTGQCEFRAFFIGDEGDVLAALTHEVAEEPNEESNRQLREAVDFAIEHGLAAPNAEDELIVWSELARGFSDGVTAV